MPARLRAFVRRWRARLSRPFKRKSSPPNEGSTDAHTAPDVSGLYNQANQNIGAQLSQGSSDASVTEMSGSGPSAGPQRARLGRAHTL